MSNENSELIKLQFWTDQFRRRIQLTVSQETAARLARVHMAKHPDLGAYATGRAALMAGLRVLEKELEGGA